MKRRNEHPEVAEGGIREGDCLAVLKTLEADSVSAVLADPPYGLAFMGKAWDRYTPAAFQDWCGRWAAELLRVCRPGAHMVSFGGTRTHHRLACALEDAGWEVRDTLCWLYGQGFPKSLDLSKAFDKQAGAKREIAGPALKPRDGSPIRESGGKNRPFSGGYSQTREGGQRMVTVAATDLARQWAGWGTALKPGWEPILLCRKPLSEANVAANVRRWGTGALNIDACRLPIADCPKYKTPGSGRVGQGRVYGGGYSGAYAGAVDPHPDSPRHSARGRWPANVCLDEAAAEFLDAQTGERPASARECVTRNDPGGSGVAFVVPHKFRNGHGLPDSGGASRFFYCAKSSTKERNSGLDRSEIITIECWKKGNDLWENADLKVRLLVDTEPLHPRVIDVFGARNNSVSEWNMILSGNSTVGQYLLDSACTTVTGKRQTIGSKILNLFRFLPANENREAANGTETSGKNPAASADLGILRLITTSARTASALGVENAALPMRLRISANAERCEHPTVKPVALMRWLCRLVCPPGGLVLDPFCGSGTTGIAAALEGLPFLGIEREAEYVRIARRRIAHAHAHPQAFADPQGAGIPLSVNGKPRSLPPGTPLFAETAP